MTAKVRDKERRGGEGAPGARAEIPPQPVERTVVEQTSTLQPVEDPMMEQAEMP